MSKLKTLGARYPLVEGYWRVGASRLDIFNPRFDSSPIQESKTLIRKPIRHSFGSNQLQVWCLNLSQIAPLLPLRQIVYVNRGGYLPYRFLFP